MTKSNKQTRGMDWAAIFERRPDLIPPGYQETIDKLYPKEDSDEPKTDLIPGRLCVTLSTPWLSTFCACPPTPPAASGSSRTSPADIVGQSWIECLDRQYRSEYAYADAPTEYIAKTLEAFDKEVA